MHEPEIQPLQSLIRRVQHIIVLLLRRQRIPPGLAHLVAPEVEQLDKVKQDNVETDDPQQNLVSAAIQRLIIIAIDVGGNDITWVRVSVMLGRG